MKYSKVTVSRLAYLAGITVTMMGLVVECIFMYTMGYPYWMERNMVRTSCITQKRQLLDWSMPCQTSEKGRAGQFPCYLVQVAFLDKTELPLTNVSHDGQFNLTVKPARAARWNRLPAAQRNRLFFDWTRRVRLAVLYQSYFEWKEAKAEKFECALSPCNMSAQQNVAQVLSFVGRYGRLSGYEFDCYHSDSFDSNAVLVNLITTEVPILPHLLSWPLVFAVLGLISLIINGCLMGCAVWKDAILV